MTFREKLHAIPISKIAMGDNANGTPALILEWSALLITGAQQMRVVDDNNYHGTRKVGIPFRNLNEMTEGMLI